MKDPTPSRSGDLDAVAQLVEQLERDLAQARAGTANVDTLRAEVEQLRVCCRSRNRRRARFTRACMACAPACTNSATN